MRPAKQAIPLRSIACLAGEEKARPKGLAFTDKRLHPLSGDFQGDGSDTRFGQITAPVTMRGVHSNVGYGAAWDALEGSALNGSPATNLAVNPRWRDLTDSLGVRTGAAVSLTGSVSFWSGANAGATGNARLVDDYIILGVSGADSNVTLKFGGLVVGKKYDLTLYGRDGGREYKATVNSIVENSVNSSGYTFVSLIANASGELTVSIEKSTGEGDITGFQILGAAFSAVSDSDRDSLNDNWEMTHYGNLTTVKATDDTDGDGFTSFEEMVFGADPNVNNSGQWPVQNSLVDDAGVAKLEFKFRRPQNHATLNVVYTLEASNNMQGGNWTPMVMTPTITQSGNNEWVTYLLPMPSGGETCVFYRIKVTLEP